jgi:hypothetical protein
LTLTLAGGEWSASRPDRFIPGGRASGTHWIGGCVSPRAGLEEHFHRLQSTFSSVCQYPAFKPIEKGPYYHNIIEVTFMAYLLKWEENTEIYLTQTEYVCEGSNVSNLPLQPRHWQICISWWRSDRKLPHVTSYEQQTHKIKHNGCLKSQIGKDAVGESFLEKISSFLRCGRTRRRKEGGTNKEVTKWIHLAQGSVTKSCEHGDKTFGFHKRWWISWVARRLLALFS